jgi:hypothetical protein
MSVHPQSEEVAPVQVIDPLSAAPLEIRSLIQGVGGRLRSEFTGIYGEETIQRLIVESKESLSAAKVRASSPCSPNASPVSAYVRLPASRER